MAEDRRFETDELLVRPGTYFNPQTEVLVVVDDSSSMDAEIFNLHNHTWSYDQKVSRVVDRHLLKMGFRWMRSSGNTLPTLPSK